MTVIVIDTQVSNLQSVCTALKKLHFTARIISTATQLYAHIPHIQAHRPPFAITRKRMPPLIFPGIGDARSTMETLTRRGLCEALRNFIAVGGAVLGICVGAQLLLQRSEERDALGMRIVRGTNHRLSEYAADGQRLKIPHMGWNTIRFRCYSPLFRGIPQESAFYFVHSYCVQPTLHGQSVAWTEYGERVPVSFCAENRIFGVQFHPEKSGPVGLRLMSNFVHHAMLLRTQRYTSHVT